MKEISVHHDPTMVGFQKSILEGAGIDCFVRNEHTSATFGAGLLGLVQSPIFDPVLCIVDDGRYEEALALLSGRSSEASEARTDWRCPACGESVPGNFETCWNCQSDNSDVKNGGSP